MQFHLPKMETIYSLEEKIKLFIFSMEPGLWAHNCTNSKLMMKSMLANSVWMANI